MNDFVFVSVAFGDLYAKQQTRLHYSIRKHYSVEHHINWGNQLPPGSKPHKESPYGFKVHAVEYARSRGHKKIIWIDTACILQDKVDYWFTLIDKYGVVAARDDNKLKGCIGERALLYFGAPDISSLHLVGGSLYVFDFDNKVSERIFQTWKKAEADGRFADEKYHRHDESCMSMALWFNYCEPTPYDVARYNNGPGSIVIKDHFK